MAIIFAILTVVLYCISVKDVDTGYGTIQVANIQATVFTAAAALACILNVIGAFILSAIENNEQSFSSQITKLKETIYSLEKADNIEYSTQMGSQHTACKTTAANKPQQDEQPSEMNGWKLIGDSLVECPQCKAHMGVSFMKDKKCCPKCGQTFIE